MKFSSGFAKTLTPRPLLLDPEPIASHLTCAGCGLRDELTHSLHWTEICRSRRELGCFSDELQSKKNADATGLEVMQQQIDFAASEMASKP